MGWNPIKGKIAGPGSNTNFIGLEKGGGLIFPHAGMEKEKPPGEGRGGPEGKRFKRGKKRDLILLSPEGGGAFSKRKKDGYVRQKKNGKRKGDRKIFLRVRGASPWQAKGKTFRYKKEEEKGVGRDLTETHLCAVKKKRTLYPALQERGGRGEEKRATQLLQKQPNETSSTSISKKEGCPQQSRCQKGGGATREGKEGRESSD